MIKRKLGQRGPDVSAIGFGCMGLNHHRGLKRWSVAMPLRSCGRRMSGA